MFFVNYLPEFLYQPLKLSNVRPRDFANSKHVHKYYSTNISISDLEELAIFVEKRMKVFFCVFIFLMTSGSNIFLPDPSIFTWLTDHNKKEIAHKAVLTTR